MVSLIIVSYNCLDSLIRTLDSIGLKTYHPYELIVIDNNSVDHTAEWLERKRDSLKPPSGRIQLVFNQENQGYSAACNQGIALASGDYLAFLNSDLLVSDFWLSRLVDHLRKIPRAGMVGPLGKGIGGSQNYVQIYREIGYYQPAAGGLDHYNHLIYSRYQGSYAETKFLIGCCILVKKELIDRVGGFDQALFMSADDFDFSLRARIVGYGLYVADDVVIHHYDHQSFNTLEATVAKRYIEQGWSVFRQKWARLLQKYSMDDLFYNNRRLFFRGIKKGRRSAVKIY